MDNTIFDFSNFKNIIKITDTKIKTKSSSFIKTNNFRQKGKYYFEFKIENKSGGTLGICSDETLPQYPGISKTSYGINIHNNNWWNGGSPSSTPNWNIANNDIIGFCINLDNKLLQLYINGNFIIQKNIEYIQDKCFISVGTGSACGGIIKLLTLKKNMMYTDEYPNEYKAWDYIQCQYLLEQNNKYYSIKKEYFKNNNYIPLEITDNITDADFKKYGFDDLNLLLKDININNETFKPINKLKNINDGKFKIIYKIYT